MMLLLEELRAARVEQCAVGFQGHAVAADQRHVAVRHFVAAHKGHEVGLERRDSSSFFFLRGRDCKCAL